MSYITYSNSNVAFSSHVYVVPSPSVYTTLTLALLRRHITYVRRWGEIGPGPSKKIGQLSPLDRSSKR
jgi:hypothetical protein